MENIPISLSYLETLSTADLLELAEEYDLDIPEQLNRRFIISELLEIADELNDENIDDIETTEDSVETTTELPLTYNETQIDVILRNPAWAYVFWDISSSDLQDVINAKGFSKLILKVHFWESIDSEKTEDLCEKQRGPALHLSGKYHVRGAQREKDRAAFKGRHTGGDRRKDIGTGRYAQFGGICALSQFLHRVPFRHEKIQPAEN